MKKKIYKYTLSNTEIQSVFIPKDAVMLCVQTQFNDPQLWVIVDPKKEVEERIIEIFGIGGEIDDNYEREYIGTYQLDGGNFVFHVFERLT